MSPRLSRAKDPHAISVAGPVGTRKRLLFDHPSPDLAIERVEAIDWRAPRPGLNWIPLTRHAINDAISASRRSVEEGADPGFGFAYEGMSGATRDFGADDRAEIAVAITIRTIDPPMRTLVLRGMMWGNMPPLTTVRDRFLAVGLPVGDSPYSAASRELVLRTVKDIWGLFPTLPRSGSPVRVGPRLRPDPVVNAAETVQSRDYRRYKIADRAVAAVEKGEGSGDDPAWRPGGLHPPRGARIRFEETVDRIVRAIRLPDEQANVAHRLFDRRPTQPERDFLRAVDDEVRRHQEAIRKGEPSGFLGAGAGIGRHLPARIERLGKTDYKRRALATQTIRTLLESLSDETFARIEWPWPSRGSAVRVGPRLAACESRESAEDLLRMVRADQIRVRTRLRNTNTPQLDAETRGKLEALETEYDPLIWKLRQIVVDETTIPSGLYAEVMGRSQPDTWPLLFVYGTLRRGEPAHGRLGDAIFARNTRLSGFRRNGSTLVPADADERVSGELYQVNPKTWSSLDAWEGSDGWHRQNVQLGDGSGLSAFVYLES